jgi:hypothetical protein
VQHTLLALIAYGAPLRASTLTSATAAATSARARGALAFVLMPAAAVLLVAHHAHSHHGACDMSSVTIFRQFGTAVLDGLPHRERVVLLTLGDEVLNAVRYAQRQLGHAQHVTLLDMNYLQVSWT